VVASDRASTDKFVATVVPLVLGAQRVAVTQTDAYMSAEAGLATGTSTEPWGLDASALIGAHARRGDFLEDVYGRNHRAAASTFVERMAREVNTDITLADRSASFVHTEGDSRITGYRRTLSAGKNCALCVSAASRTYHKGDLRPIHAHCACGTQSIYGPSAGWKKPTNDMLRSLYQRAGGNDYGSLLSVDLDGAAVVATNLGPTLVAA
jgi:hypothetical protein